MTKKPPTRGKGEGADKGHTAESLLESNPNLKNTVAQI